MAMINEIISKAKVLEFRYFLLVNYHVGIHRDLHDIQLYLNTCAASHMKIIILRLILIINIYSITIYL